MTTYDIQYKQGDTDTTGAILSMNDVPVDLTGMDVMFVMKNENTDERIEVNCTLGATVNLNVVDATNGGVTMHFTATSTANAGLYYGEFIVSKSETEQVRYPSGDKYISVMIWDAI